MNESGIPIAALARKNGIGPDEMLIVCDDFAIPLGELRIRLKGSSGGHNGLKSIFEQIGTQEVPRLRVGIGPVPEGMDPADFVLQTFSKAETMAVESAVERARNAAHVAIEEGVTAAMNRFSGKGNA